MFLILKPTVKDYSHTLSTDGNLLPSREKRAQKSLKKLLVSQQHL